MMIDNDERTVPNERFPTEYHEYHYSFFLFKLFLLLILDSGYGLYE